MDPYEILSQGMAAATQPLETLSRGRMMLNDQAIQRAYQQSVAESQRRYNQQLREEEYRLRAEEATRLRALNKQDAEEERLRQARVQFSSYGGDPTGKTEQQMAAAMPDLMVAREVKKATALSDAELERQATLYDAPLTDEKGKKVPQAALVKSVAEAKIRAEIDLARTTERAEIEVARAEPDYQNARRHYAKLLQQRDLAIQVKAVPIAVQGMTQNDAAIIAKIVASNPQVVSEIGKMAKGNIVLAALKAGKWETAISAIDSSTAGTALAQTLATEYRDISVELMKSTQLENRQATMTYLTQLREMDRDAAVYDQRIEAFLKGLDDTRGQGGRRIAYGRALRLEDPDALTSEAAKESTLEDGAAPASGKKQAGFGMLPDQGFTAQPPGVAWPSGEAMLAPMPSAPTFTAQPPGRSWPSGDATLTPMPLIPTPISGVQQPFVLPVPTMPNSAVVPQSALAGNANWGAPNRVGGGTRELPMWMKTNE